VEDCGSAVIVLAPQERDLQEAQFVQSAKCGERGRYEFPNLRPGDYYVFAFDRWEGAAELLKNLDQAMINQAVSVRVTRGEAATADLRVINWRQ
jgi:hypothetical protein